MRIAITLAALLASTAAQADCSANLAGNWRAYLHYGETAIPLLCKLQINSSGSVLSGTCQQIPNSSNNLFEVRRAGSQFEVSRNCVIRGRLSLPSRNYTLVFSTGSLVGNAAYGIGYDHQDGSFDTSNDFSFVLAKH